MSPASRSYPLSDLDLARRLEDAEGRSNAEYVEAQARVDPTSEATWIAVAGARAMFAGIDSPLTQTFGLGMWEEVREEHLEEIESFYAARGARVHHEVSPLADPELLPLFGERNYRPIEYTSVLFRPIDPDLSLGGTRESAIEVRHVGAPDLPTWVATAASGWSEYGDLHELMEEVARVSSERRNAHLYMAFENGVAISSGSLTLHDGVALLAGASTIPQARRRGAQLALLEHRLRDAARRGCDLAMMCARPGSASQRNAERHGFRIAYTRIKWELVDA